MNFNDAAKIAMRDTVQREIHSKAYHAVDMAIDDADTHMASHRAMFDASHRATYWPTIIEAYKAVDMATFLALREARNEL